MEDKKLKRKIDETPTSGVAEPSLSQRLRIGSNPMVGEPSSSKSSKPKTSNELGSSMKPSEPSNDGDHKENPSLDFACKFCGKRFSSSQALGGHQNAHKHERFLKTEKEKIMYGREFGAHLSTHTYPSMRNYYPGSSSNLGHGVQLHHPMSQMPSMYLPRYSSLGYGHFQGLHFSNTSLARHQFGNNSSSLGGGANAPRFNLQGVRVFHGINQIPPPANNVEADQNQAHPCVGNPLENPSVSPAAPQASSVSPDDAPQASEEMDLTLKLGFP